MIPVGQWGAQELLAPYTKTPKPFPRKHIRMLAGPPVPLDDLIALPRTQQVINSATERIMAAITALVEELRGEQAPAAAVRPAQGRGQAHRRPAQDRPAGEAVNQHHKVAVFGAGLVGDGVLRSCSPTPATR